MAVQTHHEHEQQTEQQPTPQRRGVSRRKLLGYGAAAAGVVTGLITAGAALSGGDKKPSTPNRTAPGEDQGGAAGEQPQQPETQVDPNNIHHIQEVVLADPDLQEAFRDFLDEPAPRYAVDDTGRYLYPQIFVSNNENEQLLRVQLIPVEQPQERAPEGFEDQAEPPIERWEDLQSAGSSLEWQDFGFGKISYFDGMGGVGSGVQGYTGIGADERYFRISTIEAPGIVAIPSPEERQNSFYNFTSFLFERGALG